MKRIIVLIGTVVLLGPWGSMLEGEPLSFRREPGSKFLTVKTIEVVEANVYVYATFEMGQANPIEYVNGRPEWKPTAKAGDKAVKGDKEETAAGQERISVFPKGKEFDTGPGGNPQFLEVVTLGQNVDGTFIPALRFGLANDLRAQERALVTPWVSDGNIDYYGMFARPDTPYDFKIRLDLVRKRMTAWVGGRGDDDWFLLADNVKLVTDAGMINEVHVEQYPNGPAIKDLLVQSQPWASAEKLRNHPLAKKDRVVGLDKGFKFQQMGSFWAKPGRHVTIARKQNVPYEYVDVAQAGPNHLICVWWGWKNSKRGVLISHSYDLGKTWTEPELFHTEAQHQPRIQKLKDGTLLILIDVDREKLIFHHSIDGGISWTKKSEFVATTTGKNRWVGNTSRVTELSDNSWIIGAHWMDYQNRRVREPLRMHLYRSIDRGRTWQFWSEKLGFPPHAICEPTLIELPSGKLVVYAREWREDGMPAVKGYSDDMGKTWEIRDLPFPINNRPCAGLLNDGRVMLTYGSNEGRSSLQGFVGDPEDPTGFQPSGSHLNDRYSVGLKDGALHIDNDGVRGQFTLYNFRPADTEYTTVDMTAEVKVVRNDGRAATLSVPYAGKLRIFPDHVVMAHDKSLRVDVTEGVFHTYRLVSKIGNMKLYVDGQLKLDTDKGDSLMRGYSGCKLVYRGKISGQISCYAPGFGNELRGSYGNYRENVRISIPNVFAGNIMPDVTGYSIWRRVEQILDDPYTGRRVISWVAQRDGFPDQYHLDNLIEIDASINGGDQGMSGWIQLDDGRIFVVNFTDDTSAGNSSKTDNDGIGWIRGTFVELSDLPPVAGSK